MAAGPGTNAWPRQCFQTPTGGVTREDGYLGRAVPTLSVRGLRRGVESEQIQGFVGAVRRQSALDVSDHGQITQSHGPHIMSEDGWIRIRGRPTDR